MVSLRHSPLNGWIKPTSIYQFGTGLSSAIKMLTWGWCRWRFDPLCPSATWVRSTPGCLPPRVPRCLVLSATSPACPPATGAAWKLFGTVEKFGLQPINRSRNPQKNMGVDHPKIWDWTKNNMSILGKKMVLLSQLCFFYIHMFVSF